MSKLWTPAPEPPSKLGRYRQLSPLAGVHVSPICFGAMSIGDKWEKLGMGAMNKESSFALLDAFYDAGGNFIDTANNYQDESSEEFIGEWMEKRGIRDQMVIATKVRTFRAGPGAPHESMRVRLTLLWGTRTVHNQLQERCSRHPAKGALHRKQRQGVAHLRRGVPQEAAHELYRHPLRPLGTCIPVYELYLVR